MAAVVAAGFGASSTREAVCADTWTPSIAEWANTAPADAAPLLLYRRELAGDEPLESPWVELGGVSPVPLARVARGARLDAEAGGRIQFKPEEGLPIAGARRAVLELRAIGNSPTPIHAELELVDEATGGRLVAPFELHGGAQRVEIPLQFLRYDRGRVPRANRVTSWGLRFVDPAVVDVVAFELWRDDAFAGPELATEDLVNAFPDPERVRVYERAPFVLLTDAPQLDAARVLDAIETMHTRTRDLLPHMPTPTSAVPLLVFADEREYRAFWESFSARFGTKLLPNREDEGFTWQGVATAWFSDRYGAVRPTYVHEAHHALLERAYGLAAQRSWLFEGLANLEQLEISHQELDSVYRRGLRRADKTSTLAELLDGRPIRTDRYWQATLFAEWLVSDAPRRAALDSALFEMAQRGSADVRPVVRRHFGSDLDALGVEFWSWAWTTYGA
jgi:hypothetical protein